MNQLCCCIFLDLVVGFWYNSVFSFVLSFASLAEAACQRWQNTLQNTEKNYSFKIEKLGTMYISNKTNEQQK